MPVFGKAKVTSDGKMVQLGPKSGPNDVTTADDVTDPQKLARLIGNVVEAQAVQQAQWLPRRIDFEDVPVVNFTDYSFQHNFNGRVRWWPVDWVSAVATAPTFLKNEALTTATTLVLTCYITGTVTIRVEESG